MNANTDETISRQEQQKANLRTASFYGSVTVDIVHALQHWKLSKLQTERLLQMLRWDVRVSLYCDTDEIFDRACKPIRCLIFSNQTFGGHGSITLGVRSKCTGKYDRVFGDVWNIKSWGDVVSYLHNYVVTHEGKLHKYDRNLHEAYAGVRNFHKEAVRYDEEDAARRKADRD